MLLIAVAAFTHAVRREIEFLSIIKTLLKINTPRLTDSSNVGRPSEKLEPQMKPTAKVSF